MLTAKYFQTLCSYQHSIYSIGGHNGQDIADCEVYNIYNDKWEKLPELKQKRRICSATVFNKRLIYAMGGWDNSNVYINSVERLNIDSHV